MNSQDIDVYTVMKKGVYLYNNPVGKKVTRVLKNYLFQILTAMKLLTFSLLLLAGTAFGQSIVTSSKEWNNLRDQYYKFSTEIIQFTSDTAINSVIYKKVERSTDPGQLIWADFGYIREDADRRVYYKMTAGDAEVLMYDFGLGLNDTVTAYGVQSWGSTFYLASQQYRVISLDSMLIGETYRNRINLAIPEDTTFAIEHWIDSTGSTSGILHNVVMTVGQDTYTMVCYFEEGELLYHNSYFDSCYINTGVVETSGMGPAVTIIPHPLSDKSVLTILGDPGNQGMEASFYDSMGRLVFSRKFSGELTLFRNDFSPGIYFYRIEKIHGTVLAGKLIVH